MKFNKFEIDIRFNFKINYDDYKTRGYCASVKGFNIGFDFDLFSLLPKHNEKSYYGEYDHTAHGFSWLGVYFVR